MKLALIRNTYEPLVAVFAPFVLAALAAAAQAFLDGATGRGIWAAALAALLTAATAAGRSLVTPVAKVKAANLTTYSQASGGAYSQSPPPPREGK